MELPFHRSKSFARICFEKKNAYVNHGCLELEIKINKISALKEGVPENGIEEAFYHLAKKYSRPVLKVESKEGAEINVSEYEDFKW